VYTALFDPRATGDLIEAARVRTSYLARVPLANRYFRVLAPFYPRAFESFDFSGYDTIVSSTTAWAKGIRVPPGATHVCYVNTVSRFAFAYDEYVGGLHGGRSFGADVLVKPMVRRLVAWDKNAAQRPTCLIANSHNVAQRIRQYYGREAEVLPCPVDVDRFSVGSGRGEHFIIASRLLPYKRIELAIVAAQRAGVPLVIAGTGPALAALRERAKGTTTTLLGYVPDAQLNTLMGDARAAILPGEEDFGLVPLEAAAAGRPTIAFRGGGALETIVEGATGMFFDEPSADSLTEALRRFDASRFDAARLRAHAETFSPARFIERLRSIVERVRAQARA
jgi:glycosyltransferase involved in cell wall biosynthesis